jgi:hypothetical protein
MYKLSKNSFGETVIVRDNNNGSTTSFVEEPANSDYQAYLRWCEEGNTPEPADQGAQQ